MIHKKEKIHAQKSLVVTAPFVKHKNDSGRVKLAYYYYSLDHLLGTYTVVWELFCAPKLKFLTCVWAQSVHFSHEVVQVAPREQRVF